VTPALCRTTTGAALVAALFVSAAGAAEIAPGDLAALPAADVVILGEVHDNPAHHENQASAIDAIDPAAVVFEMLSAEQAARVAPDLIDDAAALAAALDWEASGWPDFAMYHPVFLAARDAVLVGGTETREAARRAVADGAATVFGVDAALFGLDRPLPEEERGLRIDEQRVAHCDAMPEDLLPGMVEAQRLRDGWLARAAVEAHAETGGPVVIVTGNGHARADWGVPALLAEAAPGLSVLAIGQFEEAPEKTPPFDLWLVTEPADRPDPCAVFRQ
jgi:uncharacterized iron-regulated protein